MADTKISALVSDTNAFTSDLLALVKDAATSPVTVQCSVANLLKLFVSNVVIQVFGAGTSTYTPTATMKKCLVIIVGGGGGSPTITVATDGTAGGGGGGGTCIELFDAATIGVSQSYTVGATSTGAGNNSTLGALLTAGGGGVGVVSADSAVVGTQGAGGAGGTATGGELNIPGGPGRPGIMYSTALGLGGSGGNSAFGMGGAGGSVAAGTAGSNYGGGAGGGHTADGTDRAAVAGAAGVLYIIEFLD